MIKTISDTSSRHAVRLFSFDHCESSDHWVSVGTFTRCKYLPIKTAGFEKTKTGATLYKVSLYGPPIYGALFWGFLKRGD